MLLSFYAAATVVQSIASRLHPDLPRPQHAAHSPTFPQSTLELQLTYLTVRPSFHPVVAGYRVANSFQAAFAQLPMSYVVFVAVFCQLLHCTRKLDICWRFN